MSEEKVCTACGKCGSEQSLIPIYIDGKLYGYTCEICSEKLTKGLKNICE